MVSLATRIVTAVIFPEAAVVALSVYLSIELAHALALWMEWEKAKDETEAKAVAKFKKAAEEDEGEYHLPWTELSSYREGIKIGVTNKKERYYYEKDKLHKDVEVYKKYGSKGVHFGSVLLTGGKIYKPPVKGRTIDL